jgi:hypothetical protein
MSCTTDMCGGQFAPVPQLTHELHPLSKLLCVTLAVVELLLQAFDSNLRAAG